MARIPNTPPDAFARAISAEIRAEMARQGKLRKDLATRLGKSQNYVSLRLNDHQALDLNDLDKVTLFLGMDMHKLISHARDIAARERSLDQTGQP